MGTLKRIPPYDWLTSVTLGKMPLMMSKFLISITTINKDTKMNLLSSKVQAGQVILKHAFKGIDQRTILINCALGIIIIIRASKKCSHLLTKTSLLVFLLLNIRSHFFVPDHLCPGSIFSPFSYRNCHEVCHSASAIARDMRGS